MDNLEVAAPGETEHPLSTEEWLASRVLECITDPRAVCRFALINKNFSAASVSDLVWQKLLPPSAILDPLLAHVNYKPLSKKHLYFYLCNSITYDNGLKKFWLDPATGGECHMISAKALSIVWGDSPQYWEWKPYLGSMFSEVAYLRAVCWFDVNGTFQHRFRPGKYTISFRLQLHSNYSWQGVPVKLYVQNTTYAHPRHETQLFLDSHPFKIRSCPLSIMFATSPKQATLIVKALSILASSKTGGERAGKEQGEIDDQNQMQGKIKEEVQLLTSEHACVVDCQEGKRGKISSFSKGLRLGSRYVKPMKPQMRSNRQHGSCSRVDDDKTETSDCEKRIKRKILFSGSRSRTYNNKKINATYEAQDDIDASSNNDPHFWVECDVGEFFVEDDNESRPIEVHFSMKEVEVGRWKRGLFLDGVIIRPSYVIDYIVDKN